MRAVVLGLFALICVSCTQIGNFAEKRADRAAYGNVFGAQYSGLGHAEDFTIDDEEGRRIREMLEAESMKEDATLLSLADTLAIAMANSPDYQSRKEDLFIQALSLTEIQKDFNWDTSASSINASSTYSDDGVTAETFGDNGVDGELNLSISRTLVSGARVSMGFTREIVEYFTDPDTSSENSTLSFNVVQPLLNGFGPLVSKEPLRQAERNMIYAVRDFRRYQQGFVIRITSLYYSTLSSRDRLNNAILNLEGRRQTREQREAEAQAGQGEDYEAAQARQTELVAANGLAEAQANYQSALDNFRYELGLPIDLNVEPDPNELVMLAERGLVGLDINLDEAVQSALSNRLDLITRREIIEDRERSLEITKRNFLPNLDVSYDASYDLEDSSSEGLTQDTTVSLNIPFDWTEKRNDYRIAQINLDRERRELELFEWDVKRTVRDLWRNLELDRARYKNAMLSVELQERQVERIDLQLRLLGNVLTRALLDAQDDLLNASNGATDALVTYTINRLNFWNAIERFEIDPKGMWYEENTQETEGTVATP